MRDARAVEAAGAFAVVLEADSARACRADHARTAHSDDRNRRGPGLRRADSGAPRSARPDVSACAEIRAAVADVGEIDLAAPRANIARRAPRVVSLRMNESYHAAQKRWDRSSAGYIVTAIKSNRRRKLQSGLILSLRMTTEKESKEQKMTPEEMRALFEYNAWANRRSLDAAAHSRPNNSRNLWVRVFPPCATR